MTIPEFIIILILALSLAANFLYVIFNRQMGRYTRRWDLFRWISAFQLFAGLPRNFRIYYRDKLSDNRTTDWQEAVLFTPRQWHHLIVFPEKNVSETIDSLLDDLVRFREANPDSSNIKNLFRYRTILQFIRRFPRAETAVARQFKIEENTGFISDEQPTQTFISEFHKR